MPSLRVGIIGAGSAVFSLRIIGDLIKAGIFPESGIVLMDVDRKRLENVGVLARRFNEESGGNMRFIETQNLDEAIRDSDYVVNTALVGGHEYLEKVRSIGEKHGYYRGVEAQEFNMVSDYYTFTNFNQLNYFVKIAQKIAELSPKAWLIQAANPVFEGVTLITRMVPDVNVVGFCHGHYGVHEIARSLGMDMNKLDWQVAGFNHAIWLNRFVYDGKDAYHLVENLESKDWKPTNPFDDQLSPMAFEMLRKYGMMPIGDTVRNSSWRYHRNLDTKKKWYGEPWGGVDSKAGWEWYRKWLEGVVNSIELVADYVKQHPREEIFEVNKLSEFLKSHGVPESVWKSVVRIAERDKMSAEQHVPFMMAVSAGIKQRLIVNIPNRGVLKDIPDDVVVEIPAIVDKNGIHPEEISPPLTDEVVRMYLYPRMTRMELAVRGFMERKFEYIKEILYRDPRTKSDDQVENTLQEIINLPENVGLKKHYLLS